MAKTKLKSRRRVYEFWRDSGSPRWSKAKVGRVFHVSRERVRQIVDKEGNEKSPGGTTDQE